MNNDYAISTWILQHASFERSFSALEHSGFKSLELSGTGSALMTGWENDAAAFAQRLKSVGVSTVSVHCPLEGRLYLDSADTDLRNKSIDINRSYFQRMSECGIREFVLHPGGESSGLNSLTSYRAAKASEHELRREYVREALASLAPEAKKNGVRIAVENTLKIPVPEASAPSLLELIEGFGDHVGICLDVGHSAAAGLDPVEETSVVLESGKLFSLHLHDIEDANDHLLPGEGRLDLDSLIKTLNSFHFHGVRTLELKPWAGDILSRLEQAVSVCDSWKSLE